MSSTQETAILLPRETIADVPAPRGKPRYVWLRLGAMVVGLALLSAMSYAATTTPTWASLYTRVYTQVATTRPIKPVIRVASMHRVVSPGSGPLAQSIPSYRALGVRAPTLRRRHQVRSIEERANTEGSPAKAIETENGSISGPPALNVDPNVLKAVVDVFSLMPEAMQASKPILQLPFRWLKGKGRKEGDYVCVKVNIGDSESLDFMFDTGLTSNMIKPQACERLGLDTSAGWKVEGISGGGNMQTTMLKLDNVKIDNQLTVPEFGAVVVDFPHDADGMIGMDTLRQYDIDIDSVNMTVSFYPVGGGIMNAVRQDDPAQALNAHLIPGINLLGLRCFSETVFQEGMRVESPFLGIVDSGATHTIMNWEAAEALGLSRDDPRLENARAIMATGVDGNGIRMPLMPMKLQLCSFDWDTQVLPNLWAGSWGLSNMEFKSKPECIEFDDIKVAIGNPNFDELLKIPPFNLGYSGPVVLVGQSLLTQQRMFFSGGTHKIAFKPHLEKPFSWIKDS